MESILLKSKEHYRVSEIPTNEDPCDGISSENLGEWIKCKDSDATTSVNPKQEISQNMTIPWLSKL